MTRKDYELIASGFRYSKDSADLGAAPDFVDGIEDAARRISELLARDNPRFDRDRFLAACGF